MPWRLQVRGLSSRVSLSSLAVGTLYVVGVPAGDPNDITRRALRVLRDAALVIAEDVGWARRLLARYDITTPLAASFPIGAAVDALNSADVALLLAGWLLGPDSSGRQLIRAAQEGGASIVPVPGPSLALTILVLSGLPADSFVYLGELPEEPLSRRDLLVSAAGGQRTLIALSWPGRLSGDLADLCQTLGNRPLAVGMASEQGTKVVWRGALSGAPDRVPCVPVEAPLVLVLGGVPQQATRWEEDRLRTEIEICLQQGLGAKEVSRRLAAESGWPRREIYRLAVESR